MKYLRISDTFDAYKNNVISDILDSPNVSMVAETGAFFEPYTDYSVESIECPEDDVEADATTADILVTMRKNKRLTNGDLLATETIETHTETVTFDKNESEEEVNRHGKFDYLGKTINWSVTQKFRQ